MRKADCKAPLLDPCGFDAANENLPSGSYVFADRPLLGRLGETIGSTPASSAFPIESSMECATASVGGLARRPVTGLT